MAILVLSDCNYSAYEKYSILLISSLHIISVNCSIVCSDGDLWLVNGSVPSEGRVEVCVDGQWGTVCGWRTTPLNAQVACRQLGYGELCE